MCACAGLGLLPTDKVLCITPFLNHVRVFSVPPIGLIGDEWHAQEQAHPSLSSTLMAKLPSWLGGSASASPHKLEQQQQEDYGNHHVNASFGDNGAVLLWREGGVAINVLSVTMEKVCVSALCMVDLRARVVNALRPC